MSELSTTIKEIGAAFESFKEAHDARYADLSGQVEKINDRLDYNEMVRNRPGFADTGSPRGAPKNRWMDRRGEPVTVLAKGESFYEYLQQTGKIDERWEGVHGGDYVAGKIIGNLPRFGIEAAQTEGQDTQGGFTIYSPLGSQFIDRLRDFSAVSAAGAQFVPMETGELTLVRISSDPGSEWKRETKEMSTSAMEFGRITLKLKVVCSCIISSIELLQDAPNVGQKIMDVMGLALAGEIDRAALMGTGAAAEPMGCLTHPSVQEMAAVGALDWIALLDGIQLVEAQNGKPRSYICSPGTKNILSKLVINSESLHFAPPPPDVAELQRYVTNKCDDQLFLGDFSEVLIGTSGNIQFDVSKSGVVDGSKEIFKSMEVAIRGFMRADVAFAHPETLVRMLGITS